jgi:hypothetical protein
MLTDDSIQSMGGKARADALTASKRSQIARKASKSRWDALQLTEFDGDIPLGTGSINCAVIEKGGEIIRVINSRTFLKALGRPWKGSYKRTGMPNFIDAPNLKQFIGSELESVLELIEYRTVTGGAKRGYRAIIVPLVCEVYLAAREAGAISHPAQLAVAKACEIIMRGLARVGIEALVDEATGYQYARERMALAKILEKFIARELQPWTKTFPLEFYQNIFRLKNWPFDPQTMRGPRILAKYTDDIVYQRLAPGVLEQLRNKNPLVEGRRKHKHFQWLTGDIGHPKLLAHLEGVKILMRESKTWDEFLDKLNKYYPAYETLDLGFVIEKAKKPQRKLMPTTV